MPAPTDPQEAIDQITARGEAIRQRELARATTRLEAHGDLPPEKQAAVETLSKNIADELLAVPTKAIERAPEDDNSLAVSLYLFAPDDELFERDNEQFTDELLTSDDERFTAETQ